MKKIITYIVFVSGLSAAVLSCTKQEQMGPETVGRQLEIRAELAGSLSWATRAADDRIVYGSAAEIEGGEYIITAQNEEWGVDSDAPSGDAPAGDAPLTRGTPIASASGIANLRVNVFNTGTTDWSASSTLTAAVTATKSGNSYNTSPIYNWLMNPTTKTSLFAYSPVATSANGITESSPTKISYTVPTAVANQPDLCVAVPKMNVVNADGAQQSQTLALRHQLTAVGFSMLGWNLKITKITVSGVNTTGVLTMNTNGAHTWTSSNPGSRDVGVTQSSYNHNHNSSYADITSSNGYLMMIPQTLPDAATVTITYAATTSNATGGTLTAKLKDIFREWEPGDKITYNIRLKTAPAVTSGDLTITNYLAGYTTTSALTMLMDPRDKLTFSWSATWLKIHKGNPKAGDTNGGAVSPWSIGPNGPWSNIYFFATENNSSTTAERSATVTVTGTRSGTKTFNVKQAKTSSIKIGNLYWAVGNLVADGNNGCKIGGPTDYGLYFHFGSLVGWASGSNGDGTGQGEPPMSQRVKPSGYSGSGGWPTGYYSGGGASKGYCLPLSDNASTGIGDPCRYYLKGNWRTPTAAEYGAVDAAGRGNWTTNGGVIGRWFGTSPGTVSSSVFFPASGYRRHSKGGELSGIIMYGYYWSSSVYSAKNGYNMAFTTAYVYPQDYMERPDGYPVRCVSTAP